MAILTEEELNTVKTTVEGWVEKQGQEFLKKCLQETVTSATCNTARSVLLLLLISILILCSAFIISGLRTKTH